MGYSNGILVWNRLIFLRFQLQHVLIVYLVYIDAYIVANKAKGRISKRVFQENKAHQILRKTNISYPLIRTRTYQIYPDDCLKLSLVIPKVGKCRNITL